EIWVVAPGHSLDKYPEDFFCDKIAITVQAAVRVFPCLRDSKKAYFLGMDIDVFRFIQKNFPYGINRFIAPFAPEVEVPDKIKEHFIGLGDCGEEVIYLLRHRPLVRKKDEFVKIAKCFMNWRPGDELCFSQNRSATAHSAITAAVVMGANRITLCGCDECTSKYRRDTVRGGLDVLQSSYLEGSTPTEFKEFPKEYQTGEQTTFQEMRSGTIWLARAFQPYGIRIRKYFYDSGYQELV
ncbi:unnamed protein product, partial [marine sediment metagenome]